MKLFHARTMLGLFSGERGARSGGGDTGELGGRGLPAETSLFMSIMFPTIFALGLKGMGDKTRRPDRCL